MAEQWNLVSVLPNLPLSAAWDFDRFSFVPHSDERLHALRQRTGAARALLDNFKDAFGRRRDPTALIYYGRSDAKIPWRDIVDLRNAFAIPCICNAWQKTIGSKNVWSLVYSDYFDFCAFAPHRDGVGLVHLGFGLSSYDSADEFQGQPHPDLPGHAWNFDARPDQKLLDVLVEQWRRRIRRKKQTWRSEALFRSLAVAFRAARLPKGSDNQLFDLGIHLSLWVSAHECLVHPGAKGRVGLEEVLALLGQRHWLYASLRRKGKLVGIKQPVNDVQRLYVRMYRARNAFLHGNPIKTDQIFVGKTRTDSLFVKVAPLVYQSALESLLMEQLRPRLSSKRDRLLYVFHNAGLERAIELTKRAR